MLNSSLNLLVEGSAAEEQLISWIFDAAKIPSNRINIIPMRGRKNIIKFVNNLDQNFSQNYAALVDFDPNKTRDLIAQSNIENKIHLFYAIPDMTAWMFADKETAINYAKTDWERKLIATLPAPEEILGSKRFVKTIFGEKYTQWDFLKSINIDKAMKSTQSLKNFIEGINQLLLKKEETASNMNLKVFAGLVNEVVPADTILWKTSQGQVLTAEQISHEIESGSEIGLQYASDVLRISRDFLKSMAKRRER
ncbi:MAG: TOPRIM nucleotidyl transferase/hydrolase domain-containing protein [Snowella sp.]|nr:TOPRIM nucleotidyl transferase/hydrolase domain-containing protein [Snowella sp.]